MKVKDLIEILSKQDPQSPVIVRFMNGDAFGSVWIDAEDFDEDDVIVKDGTVIIDL